MAKRQLWERWSFSVVQVLPADMREKLERLAIYADKEDGWKNAFGLWVLIGLVLMVGFLLAFFIPFFLNMYIAFDQTGSFTTDFIKVPTSNSTYILTDTGVVELEDPEWAASFRLTIIQRALFAVLAILSPIIGYLIGFILLYFVMDKRTEQIEEVLPDVLQVISANLHAGVTPYHAVRAAAVPQFGPLGKELERAVNSVTGRTSFEDILVKVADRVNSAALQRSIKLFASSMKSGGDLAELLENLAADITERRSLKNDLITNTRQNSMFIMFTIVVGAPLLLAISIYFVDVVTNLQNTSPDSGGGGFGLGLGGEISITSSFLIKESYVMLGVTAILASLFMGSMIHGDPKKGLKMSPIVLGGTYLMFFVCRFLVTYFLGSTL